MPSEESIAFVSRLIDWMKEERLARRMTQTKLSQLSGVDLGVISRAESHERVPGMAALRDLAVALDLDWGKLVGAVDKDK